MIKEVKNNYVVKFQNSKILTMLTFPSHNQNDFKNIKVAVVHCNNASPKFSTGPQIVENYQV